MAAGALEALAVVVRLEETKVISESKDSAGLKDMGGIFGSDFLLLDSI